MTKRSSGAFALLALLIGLAGFSVTGCGLDPVTPVLPADTMDNDPAQESVVPIERSGIDLEAP